MPIKVASFAATAGQIPEIPAKSKFLRLNEFTERITREPA